MIETVGEDIEERESIYACMWTGTEWVILKNWHAGRLNIPPVKTLPVASEVIWECALSSFEEKGGGNWNAYLVAELTVAKYSL